MQLVILESLSVEAKVEGLVEAKHLSQGQDKTWERIRTRPDDHLKTLVSIGG